MRFNPSLRIDFDYEKIIDAYKGFLTEVDMLSHSNHSNISGMIEALRDQQGNLYIIMEYFSDGNLYAMRLRDLGDGGLYYQEQEIIYRFNQICLGVSYIHGKNAAHRDLDPNNIMYESGVIKIVDFGLSCHMNANSKFDKSFVGKIRFAAPEILGKVKYNA